jgi:hypothetical protein
MLLSRCNGAHQFSVSKILWWLLTKKMAMNGEQERISLIESRLWSSLVLEMLRKLGELDWFQSTLDSVDCFSSSLGPVCVNALASTTAHGLLWDPKYFNSAQTPQPLALYEEAEVPDWDCTYVCRFNDQTPKNIAMASQSLAAAYNVMYCFSIPPADLQEVFPEEGVFLGGLLSVQVPSLIFLSLMSFFHCAPEFPSLQTNCRDSCSQSILFQGSSGRPLVWLTSLQNYLLV